MSIRTRLARLEKERGWTADIYWMFPVYEGEDREAALAIYEARRKLPPFENVGFVPVEGPRPAVPDPVWPKPLDECSDEELERTLDWVRDQLKALGMYEESGPDRPCRSDPRLVGVPKAELTAMASSGPMNEKYKIKIGAA